LPDTPGGEIKHTRLALEVFLPKRIDGKPEPAVLTFLYRDLMVRD
jgi:hypothetical protein